MPKSAVTSQEVHSNDREFNIPSRTEHSVCALAGGVTALIFVFLCTPLLLRLTYRFGDLSTTVLVFGVATLWVMSWILFEALWEWRAGRLYAE